MVLEIRWLSDGLAWRGIENLLMNVHFQVCYFKDRKAGLCHERKVTILP